MVFALRILRLIWGLFLYAAGIVLTINANIGVSPWDVFHQGLARLLGSTLGIAAIITSVSIVVISSVMKEHIGLGTLSNMILIGVFIDVLMLGGIIPEAQTFASGLAMLITGLFVVGIASYFYMGAGFGAGPRDSLMVVMTRRTGRPAGFCRAIIEGIALICGWLLGGYAGIGTVISAFGIGFAVQIVFTLLKFDVRAIRQETLKETFARFKFPGRKVPP